MSRKPKLANLGIKKSPEASAELKALLSIGDVEMVDLDLVDRDENQPRPLSEVLEGLEEFANNLERDNFQLAQLPVYNKLPNGRYKIIVGERRTTAFKIKKQKSIPAVTRAWTAEEEKQIYILQYAENDAANRKPLSLIADARWWRYFVDVHYGGNASAAAEARGVSSADVSNRLALLKAPEFIQNFAVSSSLRDPATVAALGRLAKRSGDSVAQQVIEDYQAGAINGSLRVHVESLAKADKPQPQKPSGESSQDNESGGKKASKKTPPKAPKEKIEKPAYLESLEKSAELHRSAISGINLLYSNKDQGLYSDVIADLEDIEKLVKEALSQLKLEQAKAKSKA